MFLGEKIQEEIIQGKIQGEILKEIILEGKIIEKIQ